MFDTNLVITLGVAVIFTWLAIALALGVLGIRFTMCVQQSQPQPNHQLHNAYWPFTVETAVHDR